MKIEGGSVVKSPWYYRTGTRPVGAVRSLSYIATGIGPHTATVRSQLSVTSTLNIYLGNASFWMRCTSTGTTASEWGSWLTFDSTLGGGFAQLLILNSGVQTIPSVTYDLHLGEHLTVSGDTVYLMSIDGVTGAHVANYAVVCSVEWYGK